jgi:choline/glycine/proline betaine transport protein
MDDIKPKERRLWKEKYGFSVHPPVFFISVALIAFFIITTLLALDHMETIYSTMQDWMVTHLGWMFILLVTAVLIFNIGLLFTRFGSVKLGGLKAKPEYSFFTWFAMLFSAGMGIGLIFYSVAEPMMHFANPPFGDGNSVEAAKTAMRFTLLHWGLHAWAIYGLVGLALAYFAYNRQMPLTIRSVFYPLLGERIYGSAGNIIDILAVLATLFGVATSLGLGVSQIATGLHLVTGITNSNHLEVILIIIITIIACISVVTGLNRGIKWLSQFNITLAGLLALFVFIAGPTLFILHLFVQSIGDYFQHLLAMSFWTETFADTDWQASWTVFYWAWWISWSPYVGMFIARVSYGRSIREFLLGVLLVPSLITVFWFAVFGGSALHSVLNGDSSILSAVNEDSTQALFTLLSHYPFSTLTSMLAILSVTVFFVTSSDSGSLVIDIITAGGKMEPPVAQRIFWASLEGIIAIVLLLSGGLSALQTGAITTGLPFAIVIVLMCVALLKALRQDHPKKDLKI